MSHASEVYNALDEMIFAYPQRESGAIDYRIGTKISVKWRGLRDGPERQYLCNTCRVNDCEHTRRIDRYRVENFA